jgi:hypothetical protein
MLFENGKLEGESQLRPEMDKADEKLERNCPEGLGPTTERQERKKHDGRSQR